MANIVLPFPNEPVTVEDSSELLNSDLFKRLSPELQKCAENNPHILEYLHMVPISQVGIPEYHAELSRGLGDLKAPNIIYPAGNGIFIHVMVDFQDSRNHYIQIEPTSTVNIDEKEAHVELNCIQNGDKMADFDTGGDREQQLCDYIDQVTTLRDIKINPLTKYIDRIRGKKERMVKT